MNRAIRVLHLFDSTIHWDQRLAIEQLLDRLPGERFEQYLASLGPLKGEAARFEAAAYIIPRRIKLDFLVATSSSLRRLIEWRNIGLIHAWGAHAIGTALTTSQTRVPIVASFFDPAVVDSRATMFCTEPDDPPVAVLCATEFVRRHLIKQGVNPDNAVLVRPGLDFATINRAKGSDLRTRLGLGSEAVMLLTDQLATRAGGQFSAFWATAVRAFLEPNVRLVLPGCSREGSRIERLAHAVKQPHVLVLPGDRCPYEELVAVADALLIPGTAPCSATAIAWAMGAGVPVIASATPAVAELLTHNHNAFLIKPDAPKRLAMRFADAIGRRHDWSRPTEVARGQAYEVFSLRRYVEQVQMVYENVTEDRPPTSGIKDPAIIE